MMVDVHKGELVKTCPNCSKLFKNCFCTASQILGLPEPKSSDEDDYDILGEITGIPLRHRMRQSLILICKGDMVAIALLRRSKDRRLRRKDRDIHVEARRLCLLSEILRIKFQERRNNSLH
jgi:hypothetical protein